MSISRINASKPLLTQHAHPNLRPFIHPILAPDGIGELTENEPSHHRWQHGLYVGLNDVNGAGFWTEGRRAENKATDGTFHPDPLQAPQVEGAKVRWAVETQWRSHEGRPLLHETQRWSFEDCKTYYILNLALSFRAMTDVKLGAYAYGGLFLRMPYRSELGGRALNSLGTGNPEADTQRAEWVALEMVIPDRVGHEQPVCSIALMDHPGNRAHPVPWRVDSGLGVGPSPCISGPQELPSGTIETRRYRLFIRCGPIDSAEIRAQMRTFAN